MIAKIPVTYIERTVCRAHKSLENDPDIQKLPSTVDSDMLETYWNNYAYCVKCWKHIRTYDQKNTPQEYDRVTIL